MFIAFEGPDLVGKTTQAGLLVGRLRSAGHETLHLAFPSRSEFGVAARACLAIRDLPLAEHTRAVVTQACMLADRYAMALDIERQLLRGRVVVADRWALSGLVYGEVDGLDPQLIKAAQAHLPKPDLQIVLTAPIETLLARAAGRAVLDRYEQDADFLRKVLHRYQRYSESTSAVSFDGTADQGRLAGMVWGCVAALLRRKWG